MKAQLIFKITGLALMLSSCQPMKDDSSEIAKEQNDAVLEDRNDEKDADFIVNAIASNYAEIKLAQLAKGKSTNAEVKKMATALESDHGKLLQQLQAYAAKNGISVPLEETNTDKGDRGDLVNQDAKDFDKKWCKQVQNNHEHSIREFEARIEKTEDVELKNWITNTLPALKTHLQMLEKHTDSMR
jgi:putative membrane protein